MSTAAASKPTTAAKPKAVPTHPPVATMVNDAIIALKDRKGTSLIAIKKHIAANNTVDIAKLAPFIKRYLRSAVEAGKLVQAKGTGATGSFKMGKVEKPKKLAKKPVEKKEKEEKKPAAKKEKEAKKPAAKKEAKKPAAKEAKKPAVKKDKEAKKPAAKKEKETKKSAKATTKTSVKKTETKAKSFEKSTSKKPAAKKPKTPKKTVKPKTAKK